MYLKLSNKHNFVKNMQSGFTLVELLLVIAIGAILAVIGIPQARGLIIDGKVEPTASDVTKIVTKIRANFSGQGATPYTSMGATGPATAVFANTARSLSSALTVSGAGAAATITHDIGETGASITVDVVANTTTGDSFDVTFPKVNNAACPGLATQLSKTAEKILINGSVVKPLNGVYAGGTAQNLCTSNDTNTFVFTFR